MDDHRISAEATRAAAMRLFSLVPWTVLDTETSDIAEIQHTVLRGPEIGLVMLRGRMGSTGSAFNVGEATVTRCSVKLASGTEGHAYVMGRNVDHSRRAAICDAVMQDQPDALKQIVSALQSHLEQQKQQRAAKAAATKVEFFTMVRGDV